MEGDFISGKGTPEDIANLIALLEALLVPDTEKGKK